MVVCVEGNRLPTRICALCCFALFISLTLLASFFLPSHLSFKNMYRYEICIYPIYSQTCTCMSSECTH